MGGQRHVPAALLLGITRYSLYMKLGGPRASLEGCGKSILPNMAIKKWIRNETKCSVTSTQITIQCHSSAPKSKKRNEHYTGKFGPPYHN